MTPLLLLALQSAQPAPLDALFADAPTPPSCSVTLTVDVRETTDGPTEEQVYRYDRLTGAWTTVSIDGVPPEADDEDRGDDGDDEDGRVLPGGYYAEALSRTRLEWSAAPASQDTFVAEDLPDDEIVMNGRDMSGRMRMIYAIGEGPNGPMLASATAELKKRWRIPFVAKIEGVSMERRFGPAAPETGVPGAMLPTYELITFQGDVLGDAMDSAIETAFSDWNCVPGEAAQG